LEKTKNTHIEKEGFKFIGADIGKADMLKNHLVKFKGVGTRKAKTCLRVNVDTQKVLKKLVESKFAKWTDGRCVNAIGTALNSKVNQSHADIISFYNSKIIGITNFYSFAGNRSKQHLVI
jgi:ribosomal protein S13